ncbi:MAG: threonine synthase [Hyphomicrobiaceae bacterium]
MRYVSTRGKAPELGFEDVLLAGLARDGGLYVPREWPQFTPEEIAALAGRPYQEAALEIIRPFVGGQFSDEELEGILEDAYAGFHHKVVAPLVQTGPSDWILELFHGPTLAFKDVAMQVLARLMDEVLARRGERATIVGATSGDTGGAAIEAFRGREAIDIFILYPDGRVSDVQRRQMTTPDDGNVHAIAIDGTFDDCQAMVKALFNDLPLRDRLRLSGVNSINWARIMPQIVYYFTSAVALGGPARPVSCTVPTGNVGDIFAGLAARSMGLPIERLVIATNVNDILARTLETGRYEPRTVVPSFSPSMDIQISSNFERLLFELADRDAGRLVELMQAIGAQGGMALEGEELALLRQFFDAGRTTEAETLSEIKRIWSETGLVCDPHTAVGVSVARRVVRDPEVPMVTLATAHPAKFPAAIAKAIGREPAVPEVVRQQAQRKERINRLPNDYSAVAAFISARTRVGGLA